MASDREAEAEEPTIPEMEAMEAKEHEEQAEEEADAACLRAALLGEMAETEVMVIAWSLNFIDMMELRNISWKSNPAKLKEDIDQNFRSISSAFNDLLKKRLDGISINSLMAQNIMLSGKTLHDTFLSKGDHHDVVRISCGKNIMTAGTENRPVVSVVPDPEFNSVNAKSSHFQAIELEGKSLHEIFYSRAEASGLTHPGLGKNLFKMNGTIHVSEHPSFLSVSTDSITAKTAVFKSIEYLGRPIQELFGSHTYIRSGNNIVTGGTPNNPTLSVSDDPQFSSLMSVSALIGEVSMSSMTANSAIINSMTANDIRLNGSISLGNEFNVHGGCISIGCKPEHEVSSLLRTKLRIAASQNSSIHYALLVQSQSQMVRRTLNDQTVDFVVRGDGRVGVGAVENLKSRLTIKTEGGYDQLQLSTSFTPTNSKDDRGTIGNIAYDDGFLYVKTNGGWKRSPLSSF